MAELMRRIDGHNSPLMRAHNRSAVLDLLLHGPMARRDIARHLRLTPATITNAARELIEAGLVVELPRNGTGAASSADKAVPLDLRPDGAFAIGVTLGADALGVTVVDLKGTIRARTIVRCDDPAPAAVVAALVRGVEEVVARSGVPRERVVGVGVGVAGVADPDAGVVRSHLGLGWRDVALGPMLAAALGWPVRIANRVHTMAVAERLHGAASAVETSVLLFVGATMGAGVIVRGQLHDGHTAAAGLIGHVVVDPAGPPCECGGRGCLQAVASHQAVVRRARAALVDGRASTIEPAALDAISPEAMAAVYRAAEGGDALARELLADQARWVGIAAALVFALLDPALLVLAGPDREWGIDLGGTTALELVRRTADERTRLIGGVADRIVVAEMSQLNGAAAVVLADFLIAGSFD